MITMEIKSNTYDHQRWMRCINSNDLEDYVDIKISPNSGTAERQAVLDNADFLGGKWYCEKHPLPDEKRTKYDYYYLYYRDKKGNFEENDEYSDNKFIGMDNEGNRVIVDGKTNRILEKRCVYMSSDGMCNKFNGTVKIIIEGGIPDKSNIPTERR